MKRLINEEGLTQSTKNERFFPRTKYQSRLVNIVAMALMKNLPLNKITLLKSSNKLLIPQINSLKAIILEKIMSLRKKIRRSKLLNNKVLIRNYNFLS